MKLLTRDTDYALRALFFFARHKNKRIESGTLVEQLKIPRPFLRKILQRLSADGILHSYKGQGGGFILAVAPDDVRIGDVLKIFQGQFSFENCFFKKKRCPNRPACALRRRIKSLEEKVRREFEAVTIASLV